MHSTFLFSLYGNICIHILLNSEVTPLSCALILLLRNIYLQSVFVEQILVLYKIYKKKWNIPNTFDICV
jgi:hypothetical protein